MQSNKIEELVEEFSSKPYRLRQGAGYLATYFDCDISDIYEAREVVRNNNDEVELEIKTGGGLVPGIKNNSNVLIIGDLHEPFSKTGYLEFCYSIYKKYNCNEVVFIGDIIDNHFQSFHSTDPDGHSAAKELEMAKDKIGLWYKTFTNAKVCIGNHDLIPDRKSFNAGLSKYWIKSISEVLDTPNWEYSDEFIINDVLYTHGTGRKASNRMQKDLINVVQGHYHSSSYIENLMGRSNRLFAMQLGCGVDDKSYAMAYGKHFDKMHINCGVVLNNGKLPIIEYME